jgi:hypothetical protein
VLGDTWHGTWCCESRRGKLAAEAVVEPSLLALLPADGDAGPASAA